MTLRIKVKIQKPQRDNENIEKMKKNHHHDQSLVPIMLKSAKNKEKKIKI